MDDHSERIIAVASFATVHEAALMRARLAAAGIEGFLGDEYLNQMQPWYGIALGGVKLRVWAGDAEMARQIMTDAALTAEEFSAFAAEALAAQPDTEAHKSSSPAEAPAAVQQSTVVVILVVGAALTLWVLLQYGGHLR